MCRSKRAAHHLPSKRTRHVPIEISHDERSAFTTNAASGTISSYTIGRGGSLSLLAPVAATTGTGPTDLARSDDGAYLYARVRSGAVAAFAIGDDGSLTPLGEFAGAPSIGTSGLATS
jgi:6-phosphogluconolactonase (cycloisomerase 2 family)